MSKHEELSGRELSPESVQKLYDKTDGKAFSPLCGRGDPRIANLIARGWMRPCVMRCGFEAMDDGVDWTESAHAALTKLESTKPSGDA